MKTAQDIKQAMEKQFALDYNCKPEDFSNKETLVTVSKVNEGARKYEEQESFLSILLYNGKVVISANEQLQDWCKEVLAKHMSAEWGFEAGSLISIDKKLSEYGYGIEKAHIYYKPKDIPTESNQEVSYLTAEDIAALEDDERIDEAFLYEDYIDDMFGTAKKDEKGELLAVAGATNNGAYMWEMGINSFAEGKGYASDCIKELIYQVLKEGVVPYYDTSFSHLASQKVALKSGMTPAFCELRACKIDK